MLQTLATMVFLILAASGIAVIVAAIADDWASLRMALRPASGGAMPLPARIRAVASPRRARIVRVSPQSVSQHSGPRRAAA